MAPCLYKPGQRVEGVGPRGKCRTLEGRARGSLSTAPDARPWAGFFTSLCPGCPTLPGGLGHTKGRYRCHYRCHDGCGIAPPWQRSQSCSWSCLPSAALRGDVCGGLSSHGPWAGAVKTPKLTCQLQAGCRRKWWWLGSGPRGSWCPISHNSSLPAWSPPLTRTQRPRQGRPAYLPPVGAGGMLRAPRAHSLVTPTPPTSRLSPKTTL